MTHFIKKRLKLDSNFSTATQRMDAAVAYLVLPTTSMTLFRVFLCTEFAVDHIDLNFTSTDACADEYTRNLPCGQCVGYHGFKGVNSADGSSLRMLVNITDDDTAGVVVNQAIGDALSDMLLVEALLDSWQEALAIADDGSDAELAVMKSSGVNISCMMYSVRARCSRSSRSAAARSSRCASGSRT